MYTTISDGVRLAWQTAGTGPRIALVMGLGMPGRIWGDVRDALSREFSVLTYDARGMGESDLPAKPYRMRDLGDDVAVVLDAAGWSDAHVVGVSMGGMAVQETALRHRARLRSLTLIATHSGTPGAVVPGPEGLLRLAQSRVGPPEKRRAAFVKLLYPPESGVTGSDAVENMVLGATDPKHRAAVKLQLGAVFRHHTTSRLRALAGLPTLVVRPGRDLLCRPSNNDRLARAIPGAVLERFDDAGHGIVHQCPDRLAAAIARHVRHAEG
ncbi:MAG: alpha/beta fold hydrolase [Alphaproteobacteria bacterium]|nr:alpha/beta fold hydrolase [Alphaproteobacteria bacterium]